MRHALEQCKDNPQGKELLAFLMNCSLPALTLYQDKILAAEEQAFFKDGMARLAKGVPVQYVTHRQGFYGYNFFVDENVLIPRWDSEILVEEALKVLQGKVLDMCTGSGVLAITLKKQNPKLDVQGCDISTEALAVAQKNAKQLKAEVTFFQSDLFSRVKETYDGMVCNPPYIAEKDLKTLSPQVRCEPMLALDGGEDGLLFYRKIAVEAKAFLKPQGHLFLEIGYDQAEAVTDLLKTEGWQDILLYQDMENRPRVVHAAREGKKC